MTYAATVALAWPLLAWCFWRAIPEPRSREDRFVTLLIAGGAALVWPFVVVGALGLAVVARTRA